MTKPPSQSNPAPRSTSAAPGVPEIRIEIRSNPLYLAGVRELLASVAKRLGFSDEAGGQIALAVDEALCNVIRHGYSKAVDRPIWLSVWPEGGGWLSASHSHGNEAHGHFPDALRIVIEDEARQVDPATIRSRDLEEVRPGGLGVHIIQSVMDEAVYERRGPVGMKLVMLKKRQGGVDQNGAQHAKTDGGCAAGVDKRSCCSAHTDGSRPRG